MRTQILRDHTRMDRVSNQVEQLPADLSPPSPPGEFCAERESRSSMDGYYTLGQTSGVTLDRIQQDTLDPLSLIFLRDPGHFKFIPQNKTRGKADMTLLTGDSEVSRQSIKKARGLSSWFATSNSAGITSEKPKTFAADKKGSLYMNFFESSPSSNASLELPEIQHLLNVKINHALLEASTGPDAPDPYSPTAFKNLLSNAETLLSRLQTAYSQRTSALRELTMSHDCLAEELDEANTRAESLRSQLEILAHKGTLQDRRIADLERELQDARESQTSANHGNLSNAASAQSQCLPDTQVEICRNFSATSLNKDCPVSSSGVSSWSKSSRTSAAPSIDTDMGEESDAESGTGDSVFSRPRSPALTTASSATNVTVDVSSSRVSRYMPFSLGSRTSSRISASTNPRTSTSSFSTTHSSKINLKLDQTCANCRGKGLSIAWDTVELLKAENTGLKEQIESLQDGVASALEAISDCY